MTGVPTVSTDRLVLRPWRDADLGPLAKLVGDAESMRYVLGRPVDIEGAKAALARRYMHWETSGIGFWAVELRETGEWIGWAGLQPADHFPEFMPGIEVGWTLVPEARGCGLATEAGAASLRYGFLERGFERILAFHHPDNHRSENVMRKLGMEPCGTTTAPDGEPTSVRCITREEWLARQEAV